MEAEGTELLGLVVDDKGAGGGEEAARELMDEAVAFVSEEVVKLGVGEAEMGRDEVGGVEEEVGGLAPDVAPPLGEDAGADGLPDGEEGEDGAEDGVREAAEAVRPAWIGRRPPARRHDDPTIPSNRANRFPQQVAARSER